MCTRLSETGPIALLSKEFTAAVLPRTVLTDLLCSDGVVPLPPMHYSLCAGRLVLRALICRLERERDRFCIRARREHSRYRSSAFRRTRFLTSTTGRTTFRVSVTRGLISISKDAESVRDVGAREEERERMRFRVRYTAANVFAK